MNRKLMVIAVGASVLLLGGLQLAQRYQKPAVLQWNGDPTADYFNISVNKSDDGEQWQLFQVLFTEVCQPSGDCAFPLPYHLVKPVPIRIQSCRFRPGTSKTKADCSDWIDLGAPNYRPGEDKA